MGWADIIHKFMSILLASRGGKISLFMLVVWLEIACALTTMVIGVFKVLTYVSTYSFIRTPILLVSRLNPTCLS